MLYAIKGEIEDFRRFAPQDDNKKDLEYRL